MLPALRQIASTYVCLCACPCWASSAWHDTQYGEVNCLCVSANGYRIQGERMSVCMRARAWASASVPTFVVASYQIPRIIMGLESTLTALRVYEFFHLLARLQRTYRNTKKTRTLTATQRDKNLHQMNASTMALAESLVTRTP